MASNIQVILDLVRREPGLTDNEIKQRTAIEPHQQVNAICNQLAKQGCTRRERNSRGHWQNLPSDMIRPATSAGLGPISDPWRKIEPSRSARGLMAKFPVSAARSMIGELCQLDLAHTLIVLPCSGAKRSGRGTVDGPGLLQQLPTELGTQLAVARRAVARRSPRDESQLMPAIQRYSGSFYKAAGATLARATNESAHVLIISGGYGLVAPSEGITDYDTVFNLGDWPSGLLQACLIAYARKHGLRSMVAFLARTTNYAKLVRSTDWSQHDVSHAYLASPESHGARGAQITVPLAAGEAFAALWGRVPGRV